MSEQIGLLSFTEDKDSIRPYSKRLAGLMEEEEQKLVASAYQRTYRVLEENRDKLELVSQFTQSKFISFFNTEQPLVD